MSSNTIRILLVEDNPGDVRLLRESLSEGDGFEVVHARGLDQAISLLAVTSFDMVLLDLGLPESHGLDTLVRVRGIGTELPIVVITGLDDEETGLRAVQMGAQGFLVKGEIESRSLIRTIRHAIERHRMMSELELARRREHHLATHDGLTGLPNRQLFFDLLAQSMAYCKRYGQWAAVMFVDLDRFKGVNDTYGHDCGDELLQLVARRLTSCIRTSDTVARLGGDEFIVLSSNVHRTRDAAIVARAILTELSKPYVLHGPVVTLAPSIGIAIYPGNGTRPESLVRAADVAMYSAKGCGGATYRFFDASMGSLRLDSGLTGGDLMRALRQGELRLYYQPQVESSTGRITGAEALLRWDHPQMGVVGPHAFMGLAQDGGLVEAIGDWTLRAVCEQARHWQEGRYPPLRLAVNLSQGEMARDGLARRVARPLEAEQVDPAGLDIEIPESCFSEGRSGLPRTMRELREIGVRLSIDDLASAEPWLRQPETCPDAVKLSPAIVRGLGREATSTHAVESVLEVAHGLGLSSIAKGVETQEQLDCLRARRCREVQGYYFCQPLPATDFAALLREGSLSDVADP